MCISKPWKSDHHSFTLQKFCWCLQNLPDSETHSHLCLSMSGLLLSTNNGASWLNIPSFNLKNALKCFHLENALAVLGQTSAPKQQPCRTIHKNVMSTESQQHLWDLSSSRDGTGEPPPSPPACPAVTGTVLARSQSYTTALLQEGESTGFFSKLLETVALKINHPSSTVPSAPTTLVNQAAQLNTTGERKCLGKGSC